MDDTRAPGLITAPARPAATATADAARRFVAQALRRAGSLFSPAAPVWTTAVLGELQTRLAAEPVAGLPFAAWWRAALAPATPAAVRLAAELAYVHVLFAADLRPPTKRALVHDTLALRPGGPGVPEALDAALDGGIAPTGVAFKLRRRSQLRLLLDAALEWRSLPPARRRLALDDPWAFKAWLASVPHDGAQAQREVLLHLVHPAAFEPIPSPAVKRRIVEAFADHVPAAVDDVDAALAAIRRAVEAEHGTGVDLVALATGGG